MALAEVGSQQPQIESRLTPQVLNHCEILLRRKAAEIRRQMAFASQILAHPETGADAEELASQTHEEWILLSRNRLDVSLLRQIEDALLRMQEGTYGFCEDCRECISLKRLEAVPWAKRCLQCQDRCSAEEV